MKVRDNGVNKRCVGFCGKPDGETKSTLLILTDDKGKFVLDSTSIIKKHFHL